MIEATAPGASPRNRLPRSRTLVSLAMVSLLTMGAAIGSTYLGSNMQVAQAQEATVAATPAAEATTETAVTTASDQSTTTETTGTIVTPTFASDQVIVAASDGLNFRGAPTLSGEIATVLPAGLQATIVSGPVVADAYTWYQLDINGVTGWSAGEYLASADTTLAYAAQIPAVALFSVGTTVQVADGPLNLRADASLSALIQTELATGTTATIVTGPIAADGYTWYQVEAYGLTGWSAGEFLAPIATSTTTSATDATVAGA